MTESAVCAAKLGPLHAAAHKPVILLEGASALLCAGFCWFLLGLPPIHTTSCSPADLHVSWVTYLPEPLVLAVAAQDILQGKHGMRSPESM